MSDVEELNKNLRIWWLNIENIIYVFNPCTTKVFVSIFNSFKAKSAKAISSYKWIKNNIIYKKIDLTQIALFDQLYIYHKICYKF